MFFFFLRRNRPRQIQSCVDAGRFAWEAGPWVAIRPSQSQKALRVAVRDPLLVGGAHRELV